MRGLSRLGLAALAALGLFAGGFLVGFRARKPSPGLIRISSLAPQSERDVSPKGETRTVIVPRTISGRAAPPPRPAPADLGQQVSTTSTQLPALPTGGTFQAATFAKMDGQNLQIRTVEWMDTPAGRVSLGETHTTETPTTLQIPAAHPWGASVLAGWQDQRPELAVQLQYDRGPWRFTVQGRRRGAWAGVGLVW